MIFTKFNLLVFLVLFILNLIPIYFSRRRKRYSYFSIRLFILIFAGYWFMLLFYFQTFDFIDIGTSNQRLKKAPPKYETTYVIKTQYENDLYKRETLSKIMTTAVIQSIIVVLLAFFGILWLNERVEYYIRIIIIFIALTVFCIWIHNIGGVNGYETITG